MIEVIPGILEQEFSEIEKKIRLVESLVSWVQIDVLDGTLFGNSCFHDPKPFADLDTPVHLEAHLMVKNPVRLVEPLFGAGFDRLIAHLEGFVATGEEKENVYDFIHACRTFGADIVLALDLLTPVEALLSYLASLDQVLVMTIHTGRSGQKFEPSALAKIRRIRQVDPEIPIEVDGGVNVETAKLAVAAGATRLTANSTIFNSEDIKVAIEKLKNVNVKPAA